MIPASILVPKSMMRTRPLLVSISAVILLTVFQVHTAPMDLQLSNEPWLAKRAIVALEEAVSTNTASEPGEPSYERAFSESNKRR